LLVDVDVAALARARSRLQQASGFQAEVFGGQGLGEVVAVDLAIGARFEVDHVAPVHQREDGLQQVVAICTAADDVQEEVDLGGRRQVVQGGHGAWCGEVGLGVGRSELGA
jgi:hypothetical protein